MKRHHHFKVTTMMLLGLTSYHAMAANVTQVNRYATVENKPPIAQINPLLAVQQIHFPQHIKTVGDALRYWLQYSGFTLTAEKNRLSVLNEVMQQPLPQVVRNLGPLTVRDGLIVLVGQTVFILIEDPLHRQVNFKLKPAYFNSTPQHKGRNT